jgi:FAD binding domain/Berberine and berberine like
LQGTLIRPGDKAYPNARLDYDPRFDTIRPQGIVMAGSAQDVARSIAFARDRGLPFAARCGGHSYGGYSLTPGLVIDVSDLNQVRAASGTATVGAGARLIDVAAGLAPTGVVVPGGTCATVGIAGLTMGGGQGVTGRMLGLTCDALRAATVVTADGEVMRCDGREHEDLFWALRGGGGGNFGVATSFTFATHPLASLTLFTLTWPWSAAPSVLRAWQTWGPGAPPPLWSSCRLRWQPGAGPGVSIGGAWAGPPDGLDPHLDDLSSAVGSAPSRSVTTMAYLDAARYLGGCAGVPVQDCRLTTQSPSGTLPREASLAKSDFFDRPMSGSVADTLLAAIEARRSPSSLSSQEGGVLLDAWGGAIAATASDATAFPHRSARFLAQEFVTLQTGAAGDVVSENQAWLQRLWRSLRPSASGYAYVNYIDPDLQGWEDAYYGANLPRLVDVKRTYDPDDAFRFAQSVPLSLDRASATPS